MKDQQTFETFNEKIFYKLDKTSMSLESEVVRMYMKDAHDYPIQMFMDCDHRDLIFDSFQNMLDSLTIWIKRIASGECNNIPACWKPYLFANYPLILREFLEHGKIMICYYHPKGNDHKNDRYAVIEKDLLEKYDV